METKRWKGGFKALRSTTLEKRGKQDKKREKIKENEKKKRTKGWYKQTGGDDV